MLQINHTMVGERQGDNFQWFCSDFVSSDYGSSLGAATSVGSGNNILISEKII